MSVSSIATDEISDSSSMIHEEESALSNISKKIQSIWNQIYDTVAILWGKVVHIARSLIAPPIRDFFFFPLKCPFITKREEIQNQLKIEEGYCRDFWDPSKPFDPSFKERAQILEKFDPPKDRLFPIQLKNGKIVEITCRILETKFKEKPSYNFAQVPGIYVTIKNNITCIAPYLTAYLNAEKEMMAPMSARFIIISANDFNVLPESLEETGLILLGALKALKEEFGPLDQLIAHSLGTIFTAKALSQIEDPLLIPKNICLDRGPRSIWEISKKYFFGLGRLFHFLVKFAGWDANIEEDIANFYERWKERFSLVITGVKHDHYFSQRANLCTGEKVKQIEGIHLLFFDLLPLQVSNEKGQHNWSPAHLNSSYLTEKSSFMDPLESLSEAILRHSLREESSICTSSMDLD